MAGRVAERVKREGREEGAGALRTPRHILLSFMKATAAALRGVMGDQC